LVKVVNIAYKQNIDPFMGDILEDKLNDFPDKEQYLKKKANMNRLTEIDNKLKTNPQTKLTKPDLEFLYEINTTILGFGYQKDPKIEEILSKRNKTEDACLIFECTREQIATSKEEVNEHTKVYIGEWNPTIFQTIKQFSNITHLYESFPDKPIFLYKLLTDPTFNKDNAKTIIESKGKVVSEWGQQLIEKTEFSKEQQEYNLVQFTVGQLGFPDGATTDQIYTRAIELGLELCPPEVGPQLRHVYEGKDWKLIAMKQIADSFGSLNVFNLDSGDDRLKLYGNNAKPSERWVADDRWVFRFSK